MWTVPFNKYFFQFHANVHENALFSIYSFQTTKQATNFSVHKRTIKEHSTAEYYKYNII